MENLKIKYENLNKALSRLSDTLNKLTNKKYVIDYSELRDSVIQRFEFSVDTFWKYLKAYLLYSLKIDVNEVNSPRSIFRESFNSNLFGKEDLSIFIDMIEDRNRTSHTYDEALAEEILERIPNYYQKIHSVFKTLKN